MTPNQKAFLPVNIYVLRDPRDQAIRYVGKTVKKLRERLDVHLSSSKLYKRRHVCHWICQLLKLDIRPIIESLEVVPPEDNWQSREQFWIKKLRDDGNRLTNLTDGGEGWHGLRHSEETKRKIGNAHRGRKISEEQKLKQSKTMRGRKCPEHLKEYFSDLYKGRFVSQETKAKMSLARKGQPLCNHKYEKNGRAKLNWEKVREIRSSKDGATKLAREHGVNRSLIYKIRNGYLWPDPVDDVCTA